MRNLIIPAALTASVVLGSAAFAAPPASQTAPTEKPAAVVKSGPARTTTVAHNKRITCEKQWRSQKTHNGRRDAFMKACVAKG
jgi:hypothetical protein